MAQRIFQLDEAAANALLAAYQATDDGAYRTRLQAVRLYGLGYTPATIAEITGSPRSSLMLWCGTYRQGGLSALDDKRVGGNSRKLNAAQVDEVGRRSDSTHHVRASARKQPLKTVWPGQLPTSNALFVTSMA